MYQGRDPSVSRSSVYFTWHSESSADLAIWSTPVRIHGRDAMDEREYVDPELTVSHDGTIVVTYSRADNPENGVIEQYVAWSTDQGGTWSDTLLPTSWRPEDLPFHCERQKYFMGEYHIPDHVADRAYHLLHRSDATLGTTVLAGLWSSRWSVNPY